MRVHADVFLAASPEFHDELGDSEADTDEEAVSLGSRNSVVITHMNMLVRLGTWP